MTSRSSIAFLVAAALGSTAQGVVQYTMTQGGFSPTWAQYTTHSVGSGGSGISFGQTSGGNPDEHREFDTGCNAPGLGQDYSAFYISLLFANPYDLGTQGAVPQLTYSEDFRTGSSVQLSGPVIRQGANFFFAPVLTVSAANWTSSNLLTLTAADFYLVTNNPSLPFGLDASSNPDLSAAGGVIDFGVFRGSTSGPVPGGSADSAVGFIDNIAITIPSPGAWALALGCMAGTIARRRR
jgi:hypothetical protein